jgi:uncharacterized membrane-anchored protein YitT (DUF2179 family)
MKQCFLISIYQIVAAALSTFIVASIGVEGSLLCTTAYIVAVMLALNILAIILCWKRFGHALRFRISESILLIASAFTPFVEYYTFIGDNTTLPVATSKLVLLYAVGQLSWCLAVYIIPELVGKFREKRY